jgi:hypothetical protein
MKKLIFVFIALLVTGLNVNAQGLKMPQPSSSQTVTQEFGLGIIKLSYSRPNVKGRKIFGGLVPYGEVWRTGANSATVITFSDDVKIEGNNVPAGDYALFTIPGMNEWTIVFNKSVKQWGAYAYKPEEDFLRFKVKSEKLSSKVETFTIQFADIKPTSGAVQILWDNTAVSFKLATEVDSKVMAGIDEAMKGEKKPYFQAAQYYLENGKDLNKALEWVNAAEAADQKAPWVKYLKARIQLKKGDKKGAATTAEAGVKAAKEMNNGEYIRLNESLIAEAKK